MTTTMKMSRTSKTKMTMNVRVHDGHKFGTAKELVYVAGSWRFWIVYDDGDDGYVHIEFCKPT